MITITIKDWSGLHESTTDMSEAELGYTGDIERLQRMAQNIAQDKMCVVTILQNNQTIVTASYLNGAI